MTKTSSKRLTNPISSYIEIMIVELKHKEGLAMYLFSRYFPYIHISGIPSYFVSELYRTPYDPELIHRRFGIIIHDNDFHFWEINPHNNHQLIEDELNKTHF